MATTTTTTTTTADSGQFSMMMWSRWRKPTFLGWSIMFVFMTMALYSNNTHLTEYFNFGGFGDKEIRLENGKVLLSGGTIRAARQASVTEQPSADSSSSTSVEEARTLEQATANDSVPDVVTEHPPAKGGIIYFQHIVKTGGTTVRDNFSNHTRFPQVAFRPVHMMGDFQKVKFTVEQRLAGRSRRNNNKTIFIEVHGRNTPSLVEVAPLLKEWRQKAQAANIPFYAFTLLRESTDMGISFFNHFHVFGDPRFERMAGTVENLRQTLQYNPQCLYLFKGEQAYFKQDKKYNVTKEDCNQVADILSETMDFVGDTKKLSMETLPLLTYWTTGSTKLGAQLQATNVADTRKQKNPILVKSAVDESTKELIRSKSVLDTSLYQRAITNNFHELLQQRQRQPTSESVGEENMAGRLEESSPVVGTENEDDNEPTEDVAPEVVQDVAGSETTPLGQSLADFPEDVSVDIDGVNETDTTTTEESEDERVVSETPMEQADTTDHDETRPTAGAVERAQAERVVSETPMEQAPSADATDHDETGPTAGAVERAQAKRDDDDAVPDLNAEIPPAKGGIIYFQHIVKTGGTTIRDSFNNHTQFPQVALKQVHMLGDFEKVKHTVEQRLAGNSRQNKTLFLEVHGRNTPTLVEVAPLLREWRAKAEAANIPFFAFTLLRDPTDMSISFFNHFHVFGDPRFEKMNGTVANLQKTLQLNPQCLYLFKGEQAYFRRDKLYNVTADDCDNVAQILSETMDFVGDTKKLSKETLPLLTYLTTGSTMIGARLQATNVADTRKQKRPTLPKSAVDEDTKSLIQSKSVHDQSLYQKAITNNFYELLQGTQHEQDGSASPEPQVDKLPISTETMSKEDNAVNKGENESNVGVEDAVPDLITKYPPARGGIIYFQHIVKTGGTTIRDSFSNRTQFPQVLLKGVHYKSYFKEMKKAVEKRLSGQKKDGRTLFLEVHGHDTPSLVEVAPVLKEWRAKAEAANIPFFAFTLLREPVDMGISFFNHFHVFGDPRFEKMNGTVANLRKTLQLNPQCLYLFKGERAYFSQDRLYNVTADDCNNVAQILSETMDFVGDTKKLSEETLPLLTYLTTGSTMLGARLQATNVADTRKQKRPTLPKSSVDADTKELIRSKSIHDQSLYEQAITNNFKELLRSAENKAATAAAVAATA